MEGSSSALVADDNDSDPIVKEIPIFHSRRLKDNLYLFQYPLRPKQSTNEINIKKCFFKPQNQEAKLQVAIDLNSPNFDNGRAEIIAHEVDGPPESRAGKEVYFENDLVDKVFYTSSKAVKDADKYAVGTFNGKELHFTSLKGVLQFRPSFPYLEKSLNKRKRESAGDATVEDDEEAAGPSTAQQVTVKFKQSDERWKKIRENSYKALQERSAAESWVETQWYSQGSTKSTVERLRLFSESTETTGQGSSLSNAEYVRLLVPEEEEATNEPSLPSHVMSLHALRALPILEQTRLLLKDAQIIQFQQLQMLLAGGAGLTTETLLKTLPKVAVLVQGNWVIKSEVLYPKDSFSAISGVPAELMCRARDYVLYLFTVNRYVERKKVSSVMKIPSEEVKEIFTGISRLRHNRGWELVLETDHDFNSKNGDLVREQQKRWADWYQKLADFLKDQDKERTRQRRKSKSVSEEVRVNKSGQINGHCSSDNDSGTEKNKSPVVARKHRTSQLSLPS